MSNREDAEWLTEISQVPGASDASLRRSLITCDGRGEALKTAALDELLRRQKGQGQTVNTEKTK